MTTVSQAIEKRETGPQALIAQYASDFRQVLPAHIKAETFVRLSQGVLRRNADLAKAANNNPGSFLGALLECARLGHEPGTDAFALVPVGGEVQGWEQYQGVIERVYRAGAVRSVKAEVVRKNDPYRFKRSTMQVPEHDPDDFASEDERGPLVGVYAYAEMADGSFSRVVVMSKDAVMKHKAMSKGSDSATSPWKKWPESMWLKCAVHELEKWVPTSSEYRREQLRAAAEVAETGVLRLPAEPARKDVLVRGTAPDVNTATGEIVDGEWSDADVLPDPVVVEEPSGQSALGRALNPPDQP
jgi:recombination protein RecT